MMLFTLTLAYLIPVLEPQKAEPPKPLVIQAGTLLGRQMDEREKRLASDAAKVSREAGALLADGKNAEAEKILRVALDLRPRLVPARSLLAEALIRQGKDAEALTILAGLQARGRVWTEGDAARVALLRARLGQTQASRADWSPEIVLRYCDGLPEVRASLPSVATAKGLETAWTIAVGYISDLHGDSTGAAFYYGRALTLDPSNAFVNLKMGDLELRKGKPDAAASRYAIAVKGTGRLREIALGQQATAREIAAQAKPVSGG